MRTLLLAQPFQRACQTSSRERDPPRSRTAFEVASDQSAAASAKQELCPKPVGMRSDELLQSASKSRTRKRDLVDDGDDGDDGGHAREGTHNHCDEAGVICAAMSMGWRSMREVGGATSKARSSLVG